jgi:hypothetical protein
MDDTRAGKWRITQAYQVIIAEQLYLHYEGVVAGKTQRFTAARPFLSKVAGIAPRTLSLWAEVARVFSRDVFLEYGTTKLSKLLTLAPLLNLNPLPAEPGEVLLSVPGKKGKPAIQKKFADCSKEECAAALRALKNAPPPKIPESVGIVLAEVKGAYHREAGADAPDLLKVREAKDGTIEVSAPVWAPLTLESAKRYAALAKALVAAIEKHPETIASHGPPLAPPTDTGKTPSLAEWKETVAASVSKRDAELAADPAKRAEVNRQAEQALKDLEKLKNPTAGG